MKDQLIIDEMWHNFILFTKEYSEYCNDTYGYFCHHSPAITEANKEISLKEVEEIMVFIQKHLGQDILEKWYYFWPERFSKKALHKLLN